MSLFAIEHRTAAYRADFILHGLAVVALAVALLVCAPARGQFESASLVAVGWVGWTAVEYVLHRFVLHGLAPFKDWHEEHHRRPTALIFTPTILSAALIVVLVLLPALAVGGVWRACALTLGVASGYLFYAITHHATRHWRSGNTWLARRKRWHALHHHAAPPGSYGVTSGFWDVVFGSMIARDRPSKAR